MNMNYFFQKEGDISYGTELIEKFHFTPLPTFNTEQWLLELDMTGLKLHAPQDLKFKPFSLHFPVKRMQQFSQNEPLAKAVTNQKNEKLCIIDTTAGLGRDAFLLASLGHQVTMIEQNPILAALLYDALRRTPVNNLQLVFGDSEQYIANLTEKVEVIYLDPMFPERDKSALVKKEMQILQHLIASPTDYNHLLEFALLKAKKRVVIKRPRHGEFLNNRAPDFQILSKTLRFDIINTLQK